MSYTVALDTFNGPLDLLLFLVKRNEVDIHEIPIATVTSQFLEYMKVMEFLDVEQAGDFVVMAATLMEIKSRSLLPVEVNADAEEEADPRRELVKQLLEYRKFKDAAAALEERAEAHSVKLARIDGEEMLPGETPLKPVELWDLVAAFARLMRETQALQARTITIDDTPQEVYERHLLQQVAESGSLNFRDAFTPPYSRIKLIGIFLAVLELIKRGELRLEQPEPFGEIVLIATETGD
jgi:segregation and condensation protein A